MASYEQFLRNFTEEEKKTDVVKIWSALATNTERTVLEEMICENYEMSDVNNFSKDTCESWLGFFMRKIPNRVAPRCKITVTNNGSSAITIADKTTLYSSKGNYVQDGQIYVAPNGKASVTAIQGRLVTMESVKYDKFIVLNTNDIDLDTLVIKDSNNNLIQEVEYSQSYGSMNNLGFCLYNSTTNKLMNGSSEITDADTKYKKGDFFIVVGDCSVNNDNLSKLKNIKLENGDMIIHNGNYWGINNNTDDLLPFQLEYEYAIPRNGYYAFVSDGRVYIKIFKGTDVPNPQDQYFKIEYIATDGRVGEIEKGVNQFRYNANYDCTIENEKSTIGMNQITRGQLVTLLKQNFFCGTSISTIPEYNAWFNSQSEIGTAYVYGDYEEWLRTGVRGVSTGFIYVLALDANGVDLFDDYNSDLRTTLLNRIAPYKDVGFLTFVKANEVPICFDVRYKSSSDDNKFNLYVKSVIESYFDMDSLREKGLTLFDDLDLAMLIREIGDSNDVIGLDILGYHYYSSDVRLSNDRSKGIVTIETIDEPIGNAKYILTDSNGESKNVWEVITFDENNSITTDIKTYNSSNSIVSIGYRTSSLINLNSDVIKDYSKLEVKIPIKNSAIVTIDDMKSYRTLATNTVGIQAIDVNRYN